MAPHVAYIQRQIANHVRLFFGAEAPAVLNDSNIRFVNFEEALKLKEPAIAIPVDIPTPDEPGTKWQVVFNGTRLTLWNRLEKPPGSQWVSLPGNEAPMWHKHNSGTVIPAWNLFGNIFDSLTCGEERRIASRDKHGRR